MEDEKYFCKYCGEQLDRWEPSPYTGWGHDMFFCSNDDCEYFITGRLKICIEHEKNFAYRYCLNPGTGKELPIIVWCYGDLSLLKKRYDPAQHDLQMEKKIRRG